MVCIFMENTDKHDQLYGKWNLVSHSGLCCVTDGKASSRAGRRRPVQKCVTERTYASRAGASAGSGWAAGFRECRRAVRTVRCSRLGDTFKIFIQKKTIHSKMHILVSIKTNCIGVKLIVYLLVARESAGNWIVNVDAYIY